ncbi:hypothetical protein [Rhodococcus jostii]|uniref:hypothetical protein n=1 Tax=Rhodococcus jostii TaxID=132919 RepID=UPI00365E98E2
MTAPGNQRPQLDLFISCTIPTCDFPVVEPGDVCTGCQDAFDDMLRPRPAAPCVSPQFDPGALLRQLEAEQDEPDLQR